MSVLTDSTSADAAGKFVDTDVDIALACSDGFLDLSPTADRMMVDPRLAMQFHTGISDKPPEPTFAMSPSLWDQQLDNSTPLFCQPKNGEDPMEINDDIDMVAITTSNSRDSIATRKSSRTSSNSSIPSLVSSASSHTSQPKKRVRKPSRKKQHSHSKQELKSGDKEEDKKRNKYLERNRLAASKCRQKKKEWMHDLEATKAMLEAKHSALQRDYSALLQEVSQIKTLLMAHSNCHDPNIDQWIEGEARRFVRKSMDGSFNALGHRPSITPSLPASESRQSPIGKQQHSRRFLTYCTLY
jgi:cyclic AMP-dependent transcription factor ATF-2